MSNFFDSIILEYDLYVLKQGTESNIFNPQEEREYTYFKVDGEVYFVSKTNDENPVYTLTHMARNQAVILYQGYDYSEVHDMVGELLESDVVS